MNLVRPLLGARIRSRWQVLIAIALLGGLGFGVSAAAVAVARSTDSAYRRIAESHRAVHFEWGHPGSPADLHEQLRAEPVPALGEVRQWVGYAEVMNPLGVSPDYLAPWRSELALEAPYIVAGSPAERVDEALIEESSAESAGVRVGDRLQVAFMTSDFSEAVPMELVVSGISTFPAEWGLSDDTLVTPTVLLSRAFAEAHPELVVWYSAGAVLDSPPSRQEASALIEPFGGTLENLSIEKEANVRAALRPAVTSLYVLGALGLVATVAVLAFALGRELEPWGNDRNVLRALGMPRRARQLIEALHVATVIGVAITIAVPTMLLLGRLGPVGDLRRFDAPRGLDIDWLAAALVVGGGLLAALIAVNIANRPEAGPSTAPVHDVAASLLVGSASTSRRTIGLTMLLGLLAIAAAAATIPYATSLVTLADEPARYGQPWDVMVRNRWGNQSVDAVAALISDPAVRSASTIASGPVQIDGRLSAPAARYEVVKGDDLLTVVSGRTAQRVDEAVIGASTRRQLGLELGDSVQLRFRGWEGFGPPQTVTLVGDGLFPALSVPGGAVPRLDHGIVVGPETWAALSGIDDRPEVTLLSTHSIQDARRIATEFVQVEDDGPTYPASEWFIGAQPAEIRTVETALGFMLAGLIVLTVVVAAVLGLAMRTILAGQRRDLAVLRALGASRLQLRRIARKQGLLLLVPLVALGVPFGIALGRLMFSRLAQSIGVVSEPATPWWATAAFVGAIAIICAISIAISGRATGTIAPAQSLREP